MMAGQRPGKFSRAMTECDSVKRKYLHVHDDMPIFWAYPAVHLTAQLIFQRFSAKLIKGNYM